MIRTSGKNNYLLTVFPRPVYNPVSFVENFISVIGKSAEGFLNRNFYLRFFNAVSGKNVCHNRYNIFFTV